MIDFLSPAPVVSNAKAANACARAIVLTGSPIVPLPVSSTATGLTWISELYPVMYGLTASRVLLYVISLVDSLYCKTLLVA